MILPNKVKEQALRAEKLIAQERMVVDRINHYLSSYLDDLSSRIKPIINNINTGLKTEGLPFEFALEALKNGHAMTNCRIKGFGRYIVLEAAPEWMWKRGPHEEFFVMEVGRKKFFSRWTPTLEDLLANDWEFWTDDEEGND
jgi:hypothetical protein